MDIRLSPEEYDDVISDLKDNDLEPEVVIKNVQKAIDNQILPRSSNQQGFDYSRYHDIKEVSGEVK